MNRIVVDVQSGEISIVPLTEQEISDLEANAVQEPPVPPPPSLADLQAQLAALQAQINELAGGN